jgi:hypothetical protein
MVTGKTMVRAFATVSVPVEHLTFALPLGDEHPAVAMAGVLADGTVE